MNSERVTPKKCSERVANGCDYARELMKREKLPIGYAIKREGKPSGDFTYIATFWIRRKNDLV